MRHSRSPPKSRSAASGAIAIVQSGPTGRLVLVIGGEQASLDVLLTAVRRRLAADSGVEFPPRLVTRRRTTGATELSTSRRVFNEIEREGGLLLCWESCGVLQGVPIGVREALSAGRMVVVAAPALVVPEAANRWPDVGVVRVTVGTDAVRPRTCRPRMMGAKLRHRARALRGEDPVDERVHHSGDLSAAVRSLTEALLRVRAKPQPVHAVKAGASSDSTHELTANLFRPSA